MVYVTVTKYSDDFIMVETPEVAKYVTPPFKKRSILKLGKSSLTTVHNYVANLFGRRDHRSIHTITVDLQDQGYNLTSTCGNGDMMVLVFHKEGIVEVAPEEQEDKEKKEKKEKKKEKKTDTK